MARKVFDYILDGEYLVGSFWHAYSIDLTTIEELHWHTFQALFRSLPEDSKIMQIISRRAWKKSSKSMDSQLQSAKEIWSFPIEVEMSDEELQKELNGRILRHNIKVGGLIGNLMEKL